MQFNRARIAHQQGGKGAHARIKRSLERDLRPIPAGLRLQCDARQGMALAS
jgi:hypothetical protein